MRYEVRIRDEFANVHTAWVSPVSIETPTVEDFNEAEHALRVIASRHVPMCFNVWLCAVPERADYGLEDYEVKPYD